MHEEQHAIYQLFKDLFDEAEHFDEEFYDEELYDVKVILKSLIEKRNEFLGSVGDEILAFSKADFKVDDIKKIIFKKESEGGLYDYYEEWEHSDEEKNYKIGLKKAGCDDVEIEKIFKKIFEREFESRI